MSKHYEISINNPNLVIAHTNNIKGGKELGLTKFFYGKNEEESLKQMDWTFNKQNITLYFVLCKKECAKEIIDILGPEFTKLLIRVDPKGGKTAQSWNMKLIDPIHLNEVIEILNKYK